MKKKTADFGIAITLAICLSSIFLASFVTATSYEYKTQATKGEIKRWGDKKAELVLYLSVTKCSDSGVAWYEDVSHSYNAFDYWDTDWEWDNARFRVDYDPVENALGNIIRVNWEVTGEFQEVNDHSDYADYRLETNIYLVGTDYAESSDDTWSNSGLGIGWTTPITQWTN